MPRRDCPHFSAAITAADAPAKLVGALRSVRAIDFLHFLSERDFCRRDNPTVDVLYIYSVEQGVDRAKRSVVQLV